MYKNVIATDTSLKQLQFAPKLPNIHYIHTQPNMSIEEVEEKITPKGSLDLITIAQALHWFDLPNFYKQAKWVLKEPNGIIAAWCYKMPRVNSLVDEVFDPFYADSNPFWDLKRNIVEEEYRSIEFPFEPVEGVDHTGPFEFVIEKLMNLEEYFMYISSWSAYQMAKDKGLELLKDDVVEKFKQAWNQSGQVDKVVKFPLFLRIGKVGKV